MELIKRLIKDEEGQGLVEYALIVGLIVVGCVAAVGLVGDKVAEWWDALSSALNPS